MHRHATEENTRRKKMKSTMEINCDAGDGLEGIDCQVGTFRSPSAVINCPVWTGIDAPQQRFCTVFKNKVEKQPKRDVERWRENTDAERQSISEGRGITRRETKREYRGEEQFGLLIEDLHRLCENFKGFLPQHRMP